MICVQLSICILFASFHSSISDGITELKPFQVITYDELKKSSESSYILTEDSAFFHFIPGNPSSNEIYLGARNKLFTVPVPVVNNAQEVLQWKPENKECRDALYMCSKKKPEQIFSCGNHIRFVLLYSGNSGTSKQELLTVCGSYGGDPNCSLFRRSKPTWIPTKTGINGRGIVSETLCPGEKNPFYYNKAKKKVFVSTHVGSRPSFVAFNVTEKITPYRFMFDRPFLYGKADIVTFHSIFRFKDKVYVIFNEEAYEADYNSASILTAEGRRTLKTKKKRYARAARVCEDDTGSVPFGGDQGKSKFFTTFFKARLLCQSPEGFSFDYIVAVNEIDASEDDPLIRAVFSADDGLTRAHGICSFRMSKIERGINNGEFIHFEMKPSSRYLVRVPAPSISENKKFTECRKGKASIAMAGFAYKYPLISDPVINDASFPWKAFSANHFNITAIATERSSKYEVTVLGTDTGLLIKLAALPKENEIGSQADINVVESIQVFPHGTSINSLLLRGEYMIVISDHEVKAIKIQRCHLRKSCPDCVSLGDPHCSWDVITQTCSPTARKYGSIASGMKYCRNAVTNPTSKNSLTLPGALIRNKTVIKSSKNGMSASYVSIVAVFCIILGFIIGCVVAFVLLKRFGSKFPTHLIREVRRRNNENYGNEKANIGSRGVSNNVQDNLSPKLFGGSNEYDNFLDHRSPPASVPLDKKLNNEVIKNNLMASLNHHKSIDNFL